MKIPLKLAATAGCLALAITLIVAERALDQRNIRASQTRAGIPPAASTPSVTLGPARCASLDATVAALGAEPDWWAQVRDQIVASEYEVSPGLAAPDSYKAPNRAQHWVAAFGAEAIAISPHFGPPIGQPFRDGDPLWHWAWRTETFGRPGQMRHIPAVAPEANGARIEYRRPGMVEWYENGPSGIEQGFTLDARPAGDGRLTITGQIAASLNAVPSADGAGIEFLTANGANVLRYSGLIARDSHGAELPGQMTIAGTMLSLVIDDRGATYPVVVDPLMTSPAWTAESNSINAQFGFSVAGVGDVNGDGRSDVLVGAPGYSNGAGESLGRVFLYLGSSSGLEIAQAWSARPGVLSGAGELGESIAAAGDVNGDGFGDILVGAPEFSDDASNSEGHAFLWLGGANGLGASGTASNADWEADSDNPQALLGCSVSTAGDVNGDGYDDIIIGAKSYGALNDEGAVFVWFGGATGLGADGTPANADWRTQWTQANAQLGAAVAGAGDVNGDGYADIIVGAPNSANDHLSEGLAFLWLGGANGLGSSGTPLNIDWYAESNQATAHLGESVAAAGDVDGDGYADVIIGAPLYDGGSADEGAAFLWHGGPGDLGATGTPANADWSAEGNQATADFGRAVGTAGDLNGDGFAEIVVGADLYDGGQANEGKAFVYKGTGTGPETIAFWTAESNQANAGFGRSVGTAGDVNGDGFGDLLVGAWLHDNGQADEGRAFLYLGSGGGPEDVAAWVAESNSLDANFGVSVASAGDVNGDGYSDIIVGAYNYNSAEGRVYVYAGQSVAPTSVPIWTAESNQAGSWFGFSAGSAGDVNGDGYSDVVVGAPRYHNAQNLEVGRAFVWYGSASGLGPNGTPANADWSVESDQVSFFGGSVGTAGDVNGDGFSDVIIGAKSYTNGEHEEGAAYVYHGAAWGLSLTANWIEERNQADEDFGVSVGTAGDVNGDGFSDVIIGADLFDGSHADEGRAWVYHGSPSGLAMAAAWFGDVDQALTFFGQAVATAGDVNGDGYSDVIVGAYLYDNGQADEGQAFVYHGSVAGLSATPAWTGESNQVASHFAIAVGTAGDVNGDGFSDVIIGADFYDNGDSDEGRAHVFAGTANGLAATPLWTAESDQVNPRYGRSVATAGDVTGDGFSDVIVGAYRYDDGQNEEGAVFLHYGNEVNGMDRIARQARASGDAPIDLLCKSGAESSFRLRSLGRTGAGRGKVRLEWEVKPLGTPFDGSGLGRGIELDSGAPTSRGSAVPLDDLVVGLDTETPYHWRLRIVTRSPFFPRSPWFSPPGNGRTETDFRTGSTIGIAEGGHSVPSLGRLAIDSRPNPFTVESTIRFDLPASGMVKLAIYDVTGRAVATLVDGMQQSGVHMATWNGRAGERTLPAGVYFARLEAQGEVQNHKILLAR